MEKIYNGIAILSGLTIVIGVIFGSKAANGFIQFVFELIDGIVSLFSSIVSIL